MSIALLALATAEAATPPTASQLAVAAFREACVYGTFKLTPGRGEQLSEKEAASTAKWFFIDSISPTERTVINLFEPANTTIIIGRYTRNKRPRYTARCVVYSHVISRADALAEMQRDGTQEEPTRRYVPDYYFDEWTMPLQDKHDQKYLRLTNDGWTRLEVRQFTHPQ